VEYIIENTIILSLAIKIVHGDKIAKKSGGFG